ncbi:AraC family transcriptional regulator [Phyllobacterium sp. UNC302MFCol5.2]|uniref:AraC family transcriptional regulator n=1 Tax=Phyllobacterium sp. UNC302MFCol5.2 TaxID=1449065 RepID=UPI00068F540B|nr:AraC family transcriptional regulator [Phyllobacterium sp. UNC302MFCol5.2]
MPTSIGLAVHLAVSELQRRGIDSTPLLVRSGLSEAALASHKRVKVRAAIEFLERVALALDDDWLGLTLAADFDLRELGMLYYVAASSERFGDALKRLDRYERIANEALDLRIVQGLGGRVGLFYNGVPRHVDRHLMESFAVTIVRLCRQLVGKRVVPLSARFMHHRADGRKIQQFLGCEVSFDADGDEIRFDASVMDLPVLGYDPYLSDLMVKSCEDALVRHAPGISPFRTDVENAITPLLPHGKAQAKTVAEKLNLSERTFARRLAAEGLSFGEILDRMRRDLAISYLEQKLRASDITWRLGFQQPSAFTHACRRWTGKSPSAFRSRPWPA